jgi:hypothetical protein
MTTGIIQYAANPSYCLAATRQQSGKQLQLIKRTEAKRNLILWHWNPLNGLIMLDSTRTGGTSLVITAHGERQALTVETITSGPNQQWEWTGSTTILNSVGFHDKVIDNENSDVKTGNRIWLYEYNGSEAQQWILSAVDTADMADLAEVAEH